MNDTANGAALQEIVRRLVEEFRPDSIYLFGSQAWGTPTSDSDYDILVVLPESNDTPVKRTQRAYGLTWGIGIDVDILVLTRAEFERFIHVKASLAHQIMQEGNRLYG